MQVPGTPSWSPFLAALDAQVAPPSPEVLQAYASFLSTLAAPSTAGSWFAPSVGPRVGPDAQSALQQELRQRMLQAAQPRVTPRSAWAPAEPPAPAPASASPAESGELPAAPAPAEAVLSTVSSDRATWLRRGTRGPAVSELQARLQAAGFDPGPIDGAFGPRTERAVRAFQRAAGIQVDGVVGPQTKGALSRGGAMAPAPSARPESAAPGTGAAPVAGPSGPVPATIDGMLSWARSKVGTPYASVNPFRFGDVPWDGKPHRSVNGSDTVWNYPAGTQVFDCSGFVVAAYRQVGVDLAKFGATTSSTIANSPHLQDVSRDQLRPGDLITYRSKNGIGHVVIYLGDGQTIESTGGKGVTVGRVDWDRVSAYKRVPLPGS